MQQIKEHQIDKILCLMIASKLNLVIVYVLTVSEWMQLLKQHS